MTNNHQNVVHTQVMAEQQQGHETRKQLFGELEELPGRPVISYFTSYVSIGMLGGHK